MSCWFQNWAASSVLQLLGGSGRVDVVAKPPWFHWLFFFAVNLAAVDGAIPKLHVKNLPEKKLEVRRCHPNTAGGSKAPSQNCRWSMQFGLGAPRMPMCGKLRYSFRCTLILSCARTFLQQKPVLKDIFIPARLQHINVNMLRIFVIEEAFLP